MLEVGYIDPASILFVIFCHSHTKHFTRAGVASDVICFYSLLYFEYSLCGSHGLMSTLALLSVG